MSASLVGSEMCIRDRPWRPCVGCAASSRAGSGRALRCSSRYALRAPARCAVALGRRLPP
eukprot:6431758-Alexandrium_andersonii.AAC.1